MSTAVSLVTPLGAISEVLDQQSSAVLSRPLWSYQSRVQILKKLSAAIDTYTPEIEKALKHDLGKSALESYVAEIGFVQSEIRHTLKKLKKWMKPKRCGTPMILWPARSQIISEPRGKVLIISPWNYPFQLLFSPMVGALAAGNQVVLKPSELAPETASVITRLVQETFDPRLIAVVNGGVEQTSALLDKPFDYIFYTGNGHVGRIVMEKAAKHLTPVTLELGGKSPCIIAGAPNMTVATKRVAWGKWFNVGQTCVAPDYILIEKGLKDTFLENLKRALDEFYGENPRLSSDYGKIINQRHFRRLISLIDPNKIIFGGESDESKCYIAPTVMSAKLDDPIMQDEIFGPILPIIEVNSVDEAFEIVKRRDHPLAAYIFTGDHALEQRFVSNVHAGGMCINDCLMHLSNPELPFGGVGAAGMGAYHGVESFRIFSHQKSVLKRFFFLDLKLRYPPYIGKLAPLKWLMRFLG